jgi:hypothetical protein
MGRHAPRAQREAPSGDRSLPRPGGRVHRRRLSRALRRRRQGSSRRRAHGSRRRGARNSNPRWPPHDRGRDRRHSRVASAFMPRHGWRRWPVPARFSSRARRAISSTARAWCSTRAATTSSRVSVGRARSSHCDGNAGSARPRPRPIGGRRDCRSRRARCRRAAGARSRRSVPRSSAACHRVQCPPAPTSTS